MRPIRTSSKQGFGACTKTHDQPSSWGERRQLENWGQPLGGADFRVYAAGGKAPPAFAIMHFA